LRGERRKSFRRLKRSLRISPGFTLVVVIKLALSTQKGNALLMVIRPI